MPARYVIEKSCRCGDRTYTGPTWEMAGLIPPTLQNGMERHDNYYYADKDVAQKYADILTEANPVGFVVVKIDEHGKSETTRYFDKHGYEELLDAKTIS